MAWASVVAARVTQASAPARAAFCTPSCAANARAMSAPPRIVNTRRDSDSAVSTSACPLSLGGRPFGYVRRFATRSLCRWVFPAPACRARNRGDCPRPGASEQNREMQVDEFNKRRAELHLLDVREDDEWTAGHIDGAQHIPLGELSARLAELPKERTIVAVCRSGGRSEAAVRGLRKLGFQAENLEGGVNAWDRAKLPLVDGSGGRGRVI